jgi:hypothetical protein
MDKLLATDFNRVLFRFSQRCTASHQGSPSIAQQHPTGRNCLVTDSDTGNSRIEVTGTQSAKGDPQNSSSTLTPHRSVI